MIVLNICMGLSAVLAASAVAATWYARRLERKGRPLPWWLQTVELDGHYVVAAVLGVAAATLVWLFGG